jgi:hypothetical protein
MSTPRLLITGIAACLAVGACGGGDPAGDAKEAPGAPPGDYNSGQTNEAPGGPGAVGGEHGGGEGLPAPVKVPRISQRGLYLDYPPGEGVRPYILNGFRAACGDGTVCVKLVDAPRHPNTTTCNFVGLEPEDGTPVPRGSTVKIITGTLPCDAPTGEETSEPTDPPTQVPPTDPPTTEQPPPATPS